MGHPTGMDELICTSGWEELLNLHWDPIIFLKTGSIETRYAHYGTCAVEGGTDRVLVWHISPHTISLHLRVHTQLIWYIQLGQITKAINFLLFKAGVGGKHSILNYHLTSIFVTSTGLEDIITHVKSLINSPSKS